MWQVLEFDYILVNNFLFIFIFSSGYLKAKQYMEEENYDKIISECSKEIDAQGKYMAEALLLRATFYLLIGNANAAKPDLDKVISLKDANVKVCLKMCVWKIKIEIKIKT